MTELKPTSRKVKLKLIQPQIKCSGREDVTCIYRGKVVQETYNELYIEIKVYGVKTQITFDKGLQKVVTFGFDDLVLI